jgi:hypothetical protein
MPNLRPMVSPPISMSKSAAVHHGGLCGRPSTIRLRGRRNRRFVDLLCPVVAFQPAGDLVFSDPQFAAEDEAVLVHIRVRGIRSHEISGPQQKHREG